MAVPYQSMYGRQKRKNRLLSDGSSGSTQPPADAAHVSAESLKAPTLMIGTSCDVSPGRAGTDAHCMCSQEQTENGQDVEPLSPGWQGGWTMSTSTSWAWGLYPLGLPRQPWRYLSGWDGTLDPLPSGAVRRPFLSRVSCSGMLSWASMAQDVVPEIVTLRSPSAEEGKK